MVAYSAITCQTSTLTCQIFVDFSDLYVTLSDLYVVLSDLYVDLSFNIKKMGDFIEPGTHRSTNIKVKI